MGKTCPHCQMESDRDDLCTWCNKSLAPAKAESQAPPEQAAAPAPSAAAPRTTPVGRKIPQPVAPSRPLWPYFAGAFGISFIALIGAAYLAARSASGPPPEAADWKTVQSMTKLLSLEVPGNWKFITAGSAASYEQAEVRAGKLYRVSIHGTGTKGALGDVSGAAARISGTEGGSDVSLRSEGRLHGTLGELERKKDRSYQEAGEMSACTFAGLPAAYSEYTTVKKIAGFPVTVKGWRMSCAGGDFGYDIRVEAPEKHFAAFEEPATRILGSAVFNQQ